MKRSNLLLGLTTGCLAIVSFAFAKSHQKTVSVGWCTSSNAVGCTVRTAKVTYGLTGNHKAKCANGRTAHSTIGSSVCGRTLFTVSTAD